MKTKTKIFIGAIILIIIISALSVTYGILTAWDDESIKDTLPNGWGKDATVILLAGQSNAAGSTSDEYLREKATAEKYKEYEDGYDNVYINYFSTGHNESKAFVKCSTCQGKKGGYFGPELGLAEKLNELYPNRTFFIIKYAIGGTNLYEQWLSPTDKNEAGPLYKGFIEFVNNSVSYLEYKNYNVKIEGLCWMQGEADSTSLENALNYEKNLTDFITNVRKEYAEKASDDGIAFVDAYISSIVYWKYYLKINQAKQSIADSSSNNVVIDTISHGLTTNQEPTDSPDIAHYDSLSEIKLGYLFAEEVVKFLD